METFTYRIYQDNELRKEFSNQTDDTNVFGWMLRNQHFSVHYALKFGGWKIDVVNEQTQEVRKYQSYQ
jgi:hypothetical protein